MKPDSLITQVALAVSLLVICTSCGPKTTPKVYDLERCPSQFSLNFADQEIIISAKTLTGGSLVCNGVPCVNGGQFYGLNLKAPTEMVAMVFRIPTNANVCSLDYSKIEYLGKAGLGADTEAPVLNANGAAMSHLAPAITGTEELYLVGISPVYYNFWLKKHHSDQRISSTLKYVLCMNLPGCNLAKDNSLEDPPPVKDVGAKSKSEVIRFQRAAIWRQG